MPACDATLDLFHPLRDPAVDTLHAITACYTTDPVVDTILDLAGWPDRGGCLLDPGAGDGVFMEHAVARLSLVPNDVHTLVDRIEGWEIHPDAAADARTRLARHLRQRGWCHAAATAAANRVVVEADFLAPGPVARRYAVVAGNPPYARFANLPERFKRTYQETVPDYARADLLHAFLDRCAAVLTPGGVLACVTADRWLFNQNASTLRETIGRRFGISELYRLDAASAFYRPKRRVRGAPPRVHPVVVLLTPHARPTRPLTTAPIRIVDSGPPAAGCIPLSDVADVRIAPWLGPHGVFTLNTADAGAFPIGVAVPCVDTDDVTKENMLRTPTRVALRTQRNRTPHETVLAHLDRTLSRLPPRAHQTPRWAPPEHWGPLPLDQDALLIPRIARGLRVVRLPAGVLPINHNLTVVATRPDLSLDALADALSSSLAQEWIRHHAPPLENGYLSITTKLLRRLPVCLSLP